MRDLMDGCAHSLHLAHSFTQRNALFGWREKAVEVVRQGLHFNRHRRYPLQSVHERFVMLHVAGQLRNGRFYLLRERLTVRLAHVKNLDGAKHGDLNLFFFCDRLAVRIQQRLLCVGVEFILLDLDLYGVGAMIVMPFSPRST